LVLTFVSLEILTVKYLIGSNGVLSFEFDNAGGGNGWDLQGFGSSTPDQLPNSSNTTIIRSKYIWGWP